MNGLGVRKLVGFLALLVLPTGRALGNSAEAPPADSPAMASLSPGRFDVAASGRELNMADGGSVEFVSTLPGRGRLTLQLKDRRGAIVRTLVDEPREEGRFRDRWDGRGDGGRLLKDGQYLWIARFDDGTERREIDLSDERDGDAKVKSHPHYGDWNAFENKPLKVRHDLERPSEITLVFSRETYYVQMTCDPPKFCRFLDGFQPSGEFVYEWAGVDDTGALRDDIHGIFVISSHEDLARNGVVVFGGRPTVREVLVRPTTFVPGLGSQEVCFTTGGGLARPLSALVTFTNQESLSILRTIRRDSVASGPACIPWDGRGESGALVAPGRYTVRVEVEDVLGQKGRGEILTVLDY